MKSLIFCRWATITTPIMATETLINVASPKTTPSGSTNMSFSQGAPVLSKFAIVRVSRDRFAYGPGSDVISSEYNRRWRLAPLRLQKAVSQPMQQLGPLRVVRHETNEANTWLTF